MLDLTAYQLGREIAARRVSPVEVLSAVQRRLDETEPLVNAWISRRDGEAMAEAREAEREIQQGHYRGPLHGIPIGIKDNISVAGTITTAGSRVLSENLTTEDAECVRRLRAAGAIVVGKTNLHEFAYGSTSINPHYGSVHNPWALDRIASGSSGGSGAAVAARQVPLALGTDAAGSIRMPASVCGVVGIKATFGRVSTHGLLASHNPTVDHVGPMARTVRDAALMLEVLAGSDARDPNASSRPIDSYAASLVEAQDLRGLRIGVPSNFFFDLVDPEVEHIVRAAIDALAQLGAELRDVALPDLEEMMGLRLALFADGTAFHGPHLRAHPELYGEDIRHRLLVDHFVGAHDHARATRVRRLMQARFAAAFCEVDLIAAPGTAVAAFPLEQELVRLTHRQTGTEVTIPGQLLLLRVTAPGNLVGIPAMSVPAGFTRDGCPVGLQLMGRPFEELAMLRAAYAFEQATRYFERMPPLGMPVG
jgi:aspartyl-tRNA(Asn)/glutamyl-tRNA(Gln) amidotransferase subunit A